MWRWLLNSLTHMHTHTHTYIYIICTYILNMSIYLAGAQLNHSEVNFALNGTKASAPTATPTASMPRPRCPRPRCPRIRRAPRGQRKCLRPRQRVGSQGLGFEARKLKFQYIWDNYYWVSLSISLQESLSWCCRVVNLCEEGYRVWTHGYGYPSEVEVNHGRAQQKERTFHIFLCNAFIFWTCMMMTVLWVIFVFFGRQATVLLWCLHDDGTAALLVKASPK